MDGAVNGLPFCMDSGVLEEWRIWAWDGAEVVVGMIEGVLCSGETGRAGLVLDWFFEASSFHDKHLSSGGCGRACCNADH